MLYTGQALRGIIIFVVDVQVVLADGIQNIITQQVIVYKRFGGFTGKFHHHPRRSICVHVGIFTSDIIGLDIDDFQKDITCLSLAGDAALIAVSDVFLCDILAAAFHQFYFYHILNSFYRHLRLSSERDVIGDLMN